MVAEPFVPEMYSVPFNALYVGDDFETRLPVKCTDSSFKAFNALYVGDDFETSGETKCDF